MPKRDIGTEILQRIQEIKAGQLRLKIHTMKPPATTREIRRRLEPSQAAFASLMGVSLRTAQDW